MNNPTKSSSSSSDIDIEGDDLTNATNEIQIDLNNLAEIIQAASQFPTTDDIQKKASIDEDDDTSKQATQDYDLHEVCRRKKTFSQQIGFYYLPEKYLFYFNRNRILTK